MGCPECAKLIAEIARLNYQLGKAQGELEGLRAGWSVSNHEAWKDGMGVGYKAGMEPLWIPPDNPFPKPEKAGR
jgi:hypothetical protein